ncbi:MAG: hypothetical protein D0528_09700 [Methylococcales bacterium]|nr:MAG: hypothetical protein D0528_09700 [Methylococcales bacterium]
MNIPLYITMLIRRLILLGALTLLLAGCATQAPAPVYGSGAVVRSKTTRLPLKKPKMPTQVIVPKPIPKAPPEVVETKPLDNVESLNQKLEEVQPQFMVSEVPKTEQEATAPPAAGSEQAALNSAQQPPSEPVVVEEPKPEPVVIQPPAFEPLQKFPPLSPAVGVLASAANQSSQSGNVEAATTTIERAIRIEPRNATLYYKLALLKLKQSKPRLAEDLAKKAALLASNDANMKKHSWLLIARAREVQGDIEGGKEARAKADSF